MQSALYAGWVQHQRHLPVPHGFRYGLFMVYLDLEELDHVFSGSWLWSVGRRTPASFHESDHYLRPGLGLAESIRQLVAEQTGSRPEGPIRLLTHLRYFGHCFNPVSFYYCFRRDADEIEAIVAEVANTPWNERHMYVLDGASRTPRGKGGHFSFPKAFHVSPFMPMDQQYDWTFTHPGDGLGVHMRNSEEGRPLFDATMHLRRREISPATLRWQLLAQPVMTLKVITAIYWNALRLKLKGVPFHAHPTTPRRPRKAHAHG